MKLSENPTEQETELTKLANSLNLHLADDELMITHGTEPKPHRVIFRNSEASGIIPVKSSYFNKLNKIVKCTENTSPMSYFKNNCYTLGLSKHGKITVFVKSELDIFPKEFLRSLKNDFSLEHNEIRAIIQRLDFVELEISHKINDPLAKLKNARINYDIDGLIKKLIVFTDESFKGLNLEGYKQRSYSKTELEVKGDPVTSSNLEFLLRDKLNAVLYFAELTKIIIKLTKIQDELRSSLNFVRNGITFLIDDLINYRFSEQTEQNEVDENTSR